MMYLVIGEAIDVNQTPQELAVYIENSVIPSIETMSKMEKDNVISAGGVYAGGRVVAAILNAESNEESSRLLQDLPFWGFMKWTVTPLESYDDRIGQVTNMLDRIKSMTK